MSAEERRSEVLDALGGIVDPCSIATGVPISLVDMGLVAGVEIDGGRVEIEMRLTSPVCMQVANIADAVKEAVGDFTWVTETRCSFDAGNEWEPELMNPKSRNELRRRRPVRADHGGELL